mmetsp:Transcript_49587/g.124683  ORF Transcript_49587/g.124683 Transcript_49587/m.124683 type:complete len:520 (-) Transcript_49587:44-1603(-)
MSDSGTATAAAAYLTRPVNRELLAKLDGPSDAWAYFLLLTEIPRPSHKLDAVRTRLQELAKEWSLECATDAEGNVVIKKPASKGCESAPTVALQAHLDMVCSANNDTVFDFDKDPINCRIDGEWLKATGTTLGADDGIGCAAMLALLRDPDAKHGPLECLFTVDEETTMGGAERLGKAPFLKANLLINLDSEEEYAVCVGCAGGFETHIRLPVTRAADAADGALSCLDLKVSGLQGGHTGVDIHRGRGNAIKLMAQLLCTAAEQAQLGDQLRLCAFSGGSVINTIPRECDARVAVPSERAAEFAQALASVSAALRAEFSAIEASLAFAVQPVEAASSAAALPVPLDQASSSTCLRLLLAAPHGPLRMVPGMEHEVDSSVSLSIVRLAEDHLLVHPFARASSDFQMQQTYLQLGALASLCGAEALPRFNGFPGWKPNLQGSTLAAVRKAASTLFPDKTIRTYSIHAGLECGLIIGNYPNMECVSIGPEIHDAHTPDEALLIPSLGRFYELLKASLALLTA